ncbi:MAG: signal recognition particle-docking protein FtsY [Nitrosarchaeum sp.]|jgi:fused signal recognition particle receptor|uniref:signal recognition particle-docking protein FtsY n=1 Tax=Nitrosarchaeum sp. TaxID=2026886 RepID=UPI002DF6D78D|nr:signal recognition particle-docking protein FtsY [Nitrosarchaeum sp.]MEC4847860.1 signal recognition particle-docking protein FtsY [Nitrosarchaeum sp.]
MFDKLRNAFSNAAKSLGEKELNDKDIEEILYELEISLMESDVASEVIDTIKSDLKTQLLGSKVDKKEIEKFVKDQLISNISSLFDAAGTVDLFELINEKKKTVQPFLILFVGINGTGKTTSLAKVAYMLQQAKYSVVVAAADTFRAGAIEQLREHTNRLNLKLVAQNYNSDPAAVARDAVLYAKSHKMDCVLIDTAGRMQTSKNLMEQIAKITKVVNPDFKIFVGDSLAGNDTVNQAREFFEHVKFNGSILTKSDADARGGAALSIVKITSTPVLYLGVGQEYSDLKPFDKEIFLETVFGSLSDVERKETPKPESVEESIAESKPEPIEEIKPELIPESVLDEAPKPEPKLKPVLESTLKPVQVTKPAPKQESVQEIKPESKLEPKQIESDDPFEGIADKDISKYSDLYDIAPPENDDEATKLGNAIRQWINQGRPKPGEEKKQESDKEETGSKHKQDKEEEKSKKKRGVFGFFKK